MGIRSVGGGGGAEGFIGIHLISISIFRLSVANSGRGWLDNTMVCYTTQG